MTPAKRVALALEPLDRTGVKDRLVAQLRELIEAGSLEAGQQLPSERELAEQLGVSRSSIREAVQLLEALGLVEIRHGAGTFVREAVDRERLPSEWLQWTQVHEGQVHELLEVRRGLEALAVELAAERAGKAELAELEAALDDMAVAIDGPDVPALVAADVAFHSAFAAASGNAALRQLTENLGRELLRERGAIWSTPGRPRRSLTEHRRIYDAIRAGDARRARNALIAHLRSVEHDVDALVAGDGDARDRKDKRG
jgi:GntR family transcriptional regulator, transcriptional repressor for pyruvate dehydrogenase complex